MLLTLNRITAGPHFTICLRTALKQLHTDVHQNALILHV